MENLGQVSAIRLNESIAAVGLRNDTWEHGKQGVNLVWLGYGVVIERAGWGKTLVPLSRCRQVDFEPEKAPSVREQVKESLKAAISAAAPKAKGKPKSKATGE